MQVLTVDFKANNAPQVLVESFKNTGFAVIKNHPIDNDLVHEVYREWENFFNSDEKHQYLFCKVSQHGYFPTEIAETAKGNDVKDIKEFFQIFPNGRYPKNVSNKALQLYSDLSQLAATLLEWIDQNTPPEVRSKFSIPLSEMITDSPRTMLRILHYPPLRGDEEPKAIRAAAHEDINLITVLTAGTAPGLEVLDAKGNWHQVSCEPDTIVVNAGDMLQMASGYYYRSTTHRVVNPEGNEARRARLSMPLFLHPREEVRLSEKHTARSYWLERMEELGLT